MLNNPVYDLNWGKWGKGYWISLVTRETRSSDSFPPAGHSSLHLQFTWGSSLALLSEMGKVEGIKIAGGIKISLNPMEQEGEREKGNNLFIAIYSHSCKRVGGCKLGWLCQEKVKFIHSRTARPAEAVWYYPVKQHLG